MRTGLRAGAIAAALIAASYGLLIVDRPATAGTATTGPATTGPATTATAPAAKATETEAAATADVTVPLPTSYASDVLVDDSHQQVFVSGEDLLVTDFDGQILRRIEGNYSSEMALAVDGSELYLFRWDYPDTKLVAVDTDTYVTTPVPLPQDVCPSSLAVIGSTVWFSHGPCSDGGDAAIGAYDPATGRLTPNILTTPEPASFLRALPGRPDRLTALGRDRFLGVYDVSADQPVTVAEKAGDPAQDHNCIDAALAHDGDAVIIACRRPETTEVVSTADLSHVRSVATEDGASAVVVTADGHHAALATWDSRVSIVDIADGAPEAIARSYLLTEDDWLVQSTLAFSATERLFVVGMSAEGPLLHVFFNPTDYPTPVAVTAAPKIIEYDGTVKGTGTLGYLPGEPTTATLTRRDRTGEHSLGTIPVAADGTFSFSDTPRVSGPVTYIASYAGDVDHPAGAGSATVTVRPVPYDINGDGYADTIVGSPGEDLGSDENAGAFYVLYSGPSGVTGSGSLAVSQDTYGVPGATESGDRFGYSNASGDFNGDGYADVAVSAGGEDLGYTRDAGSVVVFYGSAAGLRTTNTASLTMNTVTLAKPYAYFGDALAAGDFNGDGRDDLAIGAAGVGSGEVFVWYSPTRESTSWVYRYSQGTPGVPGRSDTDDMFGWSLAAGDVNGDGHDDLAIGAVYDWEDRGYSTGSVTILYAWSTGGLSPTGAQRWTKDTPGVPGSPTTFNEDASDGFGHQLVLADFNGDNRADLAASAPGVRIMGVDGIYRHDAGTVNILYSSNGRISTDGAVLVHQKTTGMPGNPGMHDKLGSTLAAGDTNADGIPELAIYSPGDSYVTVVPGSTTGLTFTDAKAWTQNTPGIAGATETGDWWGNSLRFAHLTGDHHAALIIGADGENNGQGAITILYSNTTGLTSDGERVLTQNSTGIPGTAETGDWFGTFF